MGVFSRLSDIINSNISALLDRAENPEKMVRLVIQEMEETLVEVRSSTARLIADRKALERREAQLQQQVDAWEKKAELALSHEREDLARAALLEKAAAADSIEQLAVDKERLDQALDKLTHEIDQLQAKLNEARARQKALLLRHEAVAARNTVNSKRHDNQIDRALNRFDHVEQRIERLESDIEARNMTATSIDNEFAELEKNSRVNDELARLREKMGRRSGEA